MPKRKERCTLMKDRYTLIKDSFYMHILIEQLLYLGNNVILSIELTLSTGCLVPPF